MSSLTHDFLLHTRVLAGKGKLLKKDSALATIDIIPAAAVRKYVNQGTRTGTQ
jgi:hypothetical protein